MKKALVLCGLMLLSACIDVDDYGEYWDKTTIDPALQGRWVKLAEDSEGEFTDNATSQEWTFTPKDGAYAVQSYDHGKAGDEDPLYPVKTLEIGKYKFLANGPTKGSILRYEVEGNTIVWYVADPEKAWEFIAEHYPQQDNIYRDEPGEDESAAEARDRPLRIDTFDDDVAAMLAAIPNNEIYWDPDTIIRKVR